MLNSKKFIHNFHLFLQNPSDVVSDWLASIDLSQYASTFLTNGWDSMAFLGEVNERHLQDMGITNPLHRHKLLSSIRHK